MNRDVKIAIGAAAAFLFVMWIVKRNSRAANPYANDAMQGIGRTQQQVSDDLASLANSWTMPDFSSVLGS